MKKTIYAVLTISILLNVALFLIINFKTAYFNESHYWTPFSVDSGGTMIFTDHKIQPDTKKYVQYFKLRCMEKNCVVEEVVLSGGDYIFSYISIPEIVKLSYERKEAILRHKDCVFTITAGATTFNCTQDNETGTLGSHIQLHNSQHGFFNY